MGIICIVLVYTSLIVGIGGRGLPHVFEQAGSGVFPLDSPPYSAGDETTIQSAATECPEITLRETSVMLRESLIPGIGLPLFQVKTQCSLKDGQQFDSVYTPLTRDYNFVVFGGYRFIRIYPNVAVGTLKCGEVLTCELSLVSVLPGREYKLATLASESCTFDYRNFIQWGYQQQGLGFTCMEGSAYYTLTCEECQRDDFPWELAYNLSGPILEESSSSRSFNYIMVITAVSIVGFAILISFVAIVIRSRRRTAIDLRVSEMVSRNGGSSREPEKLPELFIVSENDDEGCQPSSEYNGPIVVFNASTLEDDDSIDLPQSSTELRGAPSTQWSLSQIAVVDIDHTTSDLTDDGENRQGSSHESDPGSSNTGPPSSQMSDHARQETVSDTPV